MPHIKELYQIRFPDALPGEGEFFTSDNEDELHGGELYKATVLGRDRFDVATTNTSSTLSVRFSLQHEFARSIASSLTPPKYELTLFQKDLETSVVLVLWKGLLLNGAFEGNEVALRFASIRYTLRQVKPLRRYQRTCPHVLYGPDCKATESDKLVNGFATATYNGGVYIDVPEAAPFGDYYFQDGIIIGLTERRWISYHKGITIGINRPFKFSVIDQSVALLPGCDRTYATCEGPVFQNFVNHGGFYHMSLDSMNRADGFGVEVE